MLKNIILTTFSLASIFGINIILFDNKIEVNNNIKKEEYPKVSSIKEYSKNIENIVDNQQHRDEPSDSIEDNNSVMLKAYIRSLKQEAESLFDKRKFKEALLAYDKIIEITKNSTDIELLKHFAGAYFSKSSIYSIYLGDITNAIAMLDSISKRFKNSTDAAELKLYFKSQRLKAQLIENPIDKIDIYQQIADKLKNKTDKESTKMYIDSLKEIAYYSNDTDEILKIFDDIIDRAKDSNDPQILSKMIETEISKANLLSKNNEIDKAIESYDNIIDRFKDDDRFFNEVSETMLAKSYLIAQTDENQAIDVLNNLLDREESKNNISSQSYEYSAINAMELAVILDIDDSRYEEIINENFTSNEATMAEYEMLKILGNAQYSNQDTQIDEWALRHQGYNFDDWDFSNLDRWVKSIDDENVKNRVQNYLEYFKNFKPKYTNSLTYIPTQEAS